MSYVTDIADRLRHHSAEGPRLVPSAQGDSECPKHSKAARCFHRGEGSLVEYRYKNGRWKLEMISKKGKTTLQRDGLPTTAYAQQEWDSHVEILRQDGWS